MKNTGFIPVSELTYFDGTSVFIPTHEIKDYNLKIVCSGNIIELYSYDEKVYYNFESFQRDTYDKIKPDEWSGKSENSLLRARREIRRLIWCNMNKYSKFLTLTYADNMQDLQQFYYDWKLFIKSMKRYGFDLGYLYVLEYQDRGAIHAHVVIFNDEYIPQKTIENCWKHGFVKVNAIRDIKNLGAYVCKYLTKDTLAQYNSKSYHCSRGLKRPVERKITLEESVTLKQELLTRGELVYSNQFDVTINDIITNSVEYCQLKLK